MSNKCRAYSESKLGLEPPDNRKAFYAGWDAALRAALAEPVQEPIGYLWPTGRHPEFRFTQQKRDGVDGTPVYTSPPQQPNPDRIHSCSYYCTNPACIKAQRDELRDKMFGGQNERSI